MISAAEYAALVDDLLAMTCKLDALGRVVVETSQGPYSMREQALANDVPQQKEYNELHKACADKRRIVEAYDMVARYELSQRNFQQEQK